MAAIFGIIFIIAGSWFYISTWLFFKKAIIVQGKVADITTRRRGKSLFKEYAPVVEYEFNGKIFQLQAEGFSYKKPVLGKPMQVGINPHKITQVRVKQSGVFINAAFTVILIGLVFVWLEFFVVWK